MCKGSRSKWHSSSRRRDLAAVDVVLRRNLLVTAVPLTVLEAVAVTHSRAIMDSALQRSVTLDQLTRRTRVMHDVMVRAWRADIWVKPPTGLDPKPSGY